MEFELAELNERIVKATRALYTLDLMSSHERGMLSEQLGHMRNYADILYSRIAFLYPEL
jgi:hypothetical protein|nr:MAG TPA: hypothetical protein [Caudoviricetes sp.]